MAVPNFGEFEIDNQTYSVRAKAHLTEGTGEDASTWALAAVRHQETGELRYMGQEGAAYQLYGECPDLSFLKDPGYEETEVLVLSGASVVGDDESECPHFKDAEGKSLVWGELSDPGFAAEAPAPFTGTTDVMYVRGEDEQPERAFYLRLMCEEVDDEQFYSANFPAAEMKRSPVAPTQVPHHLTLPSYGLVLLVAALGYLHGQALGPIDFDFMTLFWSCGAVALFLRMFGRESRTYVASHLLSTGLYLEFMTRIIDNSWIQAGPPERAEELLVLKAAGLLAGLVLLRAASRRAYFVVADAASWAGIISIASYCIGILIASTMEEYWFGRHFAWYVGDSPWGYFWPVLLGGFLLGKMSDYKNVPLRPAEFLKQLEELRRALEAGPGELRAHGERLGVIADDLGDAVNISDDPGISQLHNFNTKLFQIREMINKVAAVEVDELDTEPLAADLRVLAEDLGDLTGPARSQEFSSLRVSPQVRVLL